MPDPIPTDDLYARLGVPADADTPAIDRAWRGLLKRHHPDVAGSVSLELAKLINVAHDWLSRPDRRARYDATIRGREGHRTTGGRPAQARPASGERRGPPQRHAPAPRPAVRRRPAPPAGPPDDLDEPFGASAPAIRSFLAQAAALTRDDIDRLSVSEAPDPVAELRQVVPRELWGRIDAIDQRLRALVPPVVLADRRSATAIRSYGHALVLELFLWFYLADPEPLLEQMRRGWESSVGLPRYGPNTDEVSTLIERLGRATPTRRAALAAAWKSLGEPEPWPADAWEFDFAALEVSAALARRDAAAAGAASSTAVRRAFASTAHVATLRPIFAPREYQRFRQAWAAIGGSTAPRGIGEEAARPTVRRA